MVLLQIHHQRLLGTEPLFIDQMPQSGTAASSMSNTDNLSLSELQHDGHAILMPAFYKLLLGHSSPITVMYGVQARLAA